MSFTSNSIDPITGFPKTIGASADYGFDKNIYTFCNVRTPSELQFNSLASRYVEIFKTNTTKELHSQYKNRTLCSFLGDEFNWVKTSYDFNI